MEVLALIMEVPKNSVALALNPSSAMSVKPISVIVLIVKMVGLV